MARNRLMAFFGSCFAFNDADGVEGLEFGEGDAEGLCAVVKSLEEEANTGTGSQGYTLSTPSRTAL